MKMKRPHLVPLFTQALEIVQQLKVMTGQYPLVFPGRNDPRKTMSEASINQVFKRVGYTGKVTGHGFRHTMSTILHEEGFNTAWIETQLAHVDKNAIRGTYNHAQYLEGRREMKLWTIRFPDRHFLGCECNLNTLGTESERWLCAYKFVVYEYD